MKNVAFHNLGCKVNSYELDVVQQKFEEKGYCIVPFDQNADIYIINTCTVTNIADRKSRQMLHQAKKRNPDSIVVALGCYVQTDTKKVKLDPCIDLAIGNNRKKDTVEIVEAWIREHVSDAGYADKAADGSADGDGTSAALTDDRDLVDKNDYLADSVIDINHTGEYEEMQLTKTGEHTRAYIKIQDGCNQFCTYCIIPFARGRVRSRRVEDICKEIKGLVKKGYREFVLTGIHISSYGVDFTSDSHKQAETPEDTDYMLTENGQSDGKQTYREQSDANKNDEVVYFKGISRLLSLIETIHEIEGVERIRLGSLEPRIITDGFAKRMSELSKICPHFHLSLQSGCDATLKRMNRHYTTKEYKKGVESLRRYYDNPAITTDVIVGFPGETDEEFLCTQKFLKEINFFEMHIFPYSRRKNTIAANMPGQVDGEIKKQRAHELLKLEEEQSYQYRVSFLGKEEDVLFEEAKEIDHKWYILGHTTRYVKVAKEIDDISCAQELSGKIVKVRLTDMLTKDIVVVI
ncbi:MAG: MiaB/RimO family radical SAM methylthiotransferase [Lachnospiraceae bacterium]|nr:MiaB/RimO family radical SAM methylthiotransferase [Lachnospiraceae bacterium]